MSPPNVAAHRDKVQCSPSCLLRPTPHPLFNALLSSLRPLSSLEIQSQHKSGRVEARQRCKGHCQQDERNRPEKHLRQQHRKRSDHDHCTLDKFGEPPGTLPAAVDDVICQTAADLPSARRCSMHAENRHRCRLPVSPPLPVMSRLTVRLAVSGKMLTSVWSRNGSAL